MLSRPPPGIRVAGAERGLAYRFHTRVRRRLLQSGYRGPLGFANWAGLGLTLWPQVPPWFGERGGDRVRIPSTGGVRFADVTLLKMHALNVAVDFWTINDPKLSDEAWCRWGSDRRLGIAQF